VDLSYQSGQSLKPGTNINHVCEWNAGQTYTIKTGNESFKNVATFKYL
jgi:hypothetical protein